MIAQEVVSAMQGHANKQKIYMHASIVRCQHWFQCHDDGMSRICHTTTVSNTEISIAYLLSRINETLMYPCYYVMTCVQTCYVPVWWYTSPDLRVALDDTVVYGM